ncbi:SWI/SNF complex subunit SWI3A-like isoform X2 [Asparagus officinalis]|uniref:SWI/SNF complex subunit SWI3A-like isoform X2 n=1 Tax=Asparagus officinalis TaxID=4686 RepID=UPI00098E7200|nr:SWI/SNF complex subunit SWI3A-like isoform X2 [Asparagus officinalis]
MGKNGEVCGICGNQMEGTGKCLILIQSFRNHTSKENKGLEIFKADSAVCSKCSENKNTKEEKLVDGSEANNHLDGGDKHANNAWTDAETLLLLEAVLKHGDDWDLIAQHVRTKNKLDCIARLIHLPFGEHMLGPIRNKLDTSRNPVSGVTKEAQYVLKEQLEETVKEDGEQITATNEKKKVTEESSPEPPTKKRCLASFTDVTDSLMNQVALLSTVGGPHVATAAAEAAIAALCHENPCALKAFEIDRNDNTNKLGPTMQYETESNHRFEDQEVKRHKQTESSPEKSFGATTFRLRAAIATSLGATAARAKLLADQEMREMELLMASIIEMQLKKLKIKMKHFEELELIMEKEYLQVQQLKESILEEWVGILKQAARAGIPRWKNNGLPKLVMNTNV